MQENYVINWWYQLRTNYKKIHTFEKDENITHLCIWKLEFQPLQIFSPGFELNSELLIAFNLVIIISFVCFLMQWKRSIKYTVISPQLQPSPPLHTRQKLFRLLWIQRNKFDRNIPYTGNLVYAIVFPKKSYSLHLTGSLVILSQYLYV